MDHLRERFIALAPILFELRNVCHDLRVRPEHLRPIGILRTVFPGAGRRRIDPVERGQQLLLIDRHPMDEDLVDEAQVHVLVRENFDEPVDHGGQVGVKQLQKLLGLDHEERLGEQTVLPAVLISSLDNDEELDVIG